MKIGSWALYGKQYETVKFLVQSGADVEFRPLSPYDNNARNKASDILLQGLTPADEEALACLTKESDWVDEQNFAPHPQNHLQTIPVHPRRHHPLRPALHTRQRRARTHTTPLGRGSRRYQQHYQLAPPVSYAADRDHADCVRLLLEAGAETDPVLPNGYIGGSALNCAARNATDPLVLKTLLEFGVDVEAAGVDGRTALIHVARTDDVCFAVLLLRYGADVTAVSGSGETLLTTAVIYNSHGVLRVLLGCGMGCLDLRVLRVAGLYGDVETLRVLARSGCFRVRNDEDVCGEYAAQLKESHDVSEKLVLAFEELLAAVKAGSGDALDEQI
ncbi:ankyrin repeat-containing domain protein [Aspergillus avenaceus]|uniref:Ankyrin repeat-containing domain protein n=1 Tax=Aspergillus avenaceus TaxID=36643 RepID=A0A5N6THT6_ASPAV|nr:ankyrin repeat-containing domain protein [Aspergillus avenaceus]